MGTSKRIISVCVWIIALLLTGVFCAGPAIAAETAIDPNQVGVEELKEILAEIVGEDFVYQEPAPAPFVPRTDPTLASREDRLTCCPIATDQPTFPATPQDYLAFRAQRDALTAKSQTTADQPSWPVNPPSRTFSAALDGGTRSLVEVNSDITANVIWTADNVYHVTADVNVQALLVIEPGTTVTYSVNGCLLVNSGGVILARGTPANPIVFTSDAASPSWGDYYCPVVIEPTASVSSTVSFCVIEFAYVGLITQDIRLDEPLHDNFIYYPCFGIGQTGTDLTDVLNNQIVTAYYCGMDIDLKSTTSAESPDTTIAIRNNTIDNPRYDGIVVHGAAYPENAGAVELVNNLVSRSYAGYGVALVDGSMAAVALCTGYYANAANNNFDQITGFQEYYPQIVLEDPYDPGAGPLEGYFLDRYSPLVDTGWGAIGLTDPQLTGSATSADREPDAGPLDIGFHYSNFDFANVGAATYLQADINRDGEVGVGDLGILATQYGQSGPARPNIAVTVDGDPNELSGFFSITAGGFDSETEQMFVFLDGNLVGEVINFDYGYTIALESYAYLNGPHELKVIAVTSGSPIALSERLEVNFSNGLHCLTASDSFKEGSDYRLAALYEGVYDLVIALVGVDDAIRWSTGGTGSSVNISVPAVAFGDESLLRIVLSEQAFGERLSGEGRDDEYDEFIKEVSKKFEPYDYDGPSDVRVLITLPDKAVTKNRWPGIKKVITACKDQGLPYCVLYHKNCTWFNVKWMLIVPNNLSHWYHLGHGHYQIGKKTPEDRTNIVLYDKRVFSYLKRDYETPPPDYRELPDGWEENGASMMECRLWYKSRLKIVQIDSCYSARNYDFAQACGSLSGVQGQDQVYLGWHHEAHQDNYLTAYYTYVGAFWQYLGWDYTVGDALTQINIEHAGLVHPRENLWWYGCGIPGLLKLH